METMKYSIRGIPYRLNDEIRMLIPHSVDALIWPKFADNTIHTGIQDAVDDSLRIAVVPGLGDAISSMRTQHKPHKFINERVEDDIMNAVSMAIPAKLGFSNIRFGIADTLWGRHVKD